MKKHSFILAAAAIVASCSSNDNFKEINAPGDAIGFTTFAKIQTKAENSTETTKKYALENYNTHFKVWGYKNAKNATGTANEDTYQFGKNGDNYPGTVVQLNGSVWTYSPLRFWDRSANYYRFFAASPANRAWIYTSTAGSEKLALNDFEISGYNRVLVGNATASAVDAPLGFTANQDYDAIDAKATLSNLNGEDLMISTDITNYKTYTSDAVNLEFNHILSRLNIGVRKSKELATYVVKLNKLEIHNLVKTASFDEGKVLNTTNAGIYMADNTSATTAQLLQNGTAARWTSSARFTDNTMKYYVEDNNNAVVPLEIKAVEPSTGTADEYRYVFQGLVIPQVVNYTATVASTDASGFKIDGSNVSDYSTYPYLVIDYEIWTADEEARTYTATDPEVIEGTKQVGDDRAAIDSYKLGGYKYFYNLSEAFGGTSSANTYFCEGYQNNLKITLKPTIITFDAEVFYWENGTTHEVNLD